MVKIEICSMQFDRKDLSDETLLQFYKQLLLPRLIEEKMLILLRQGKISKWFSGIGQEAIAVGATLAMAEDEWIMPLHRNLGVFTTRGMPLGKLFRQWQGNRDGYSNGRERSFHFGSSQHHICGMISHLGPQLAVADGVALAHRLRNEQKAALAFSGEGGTSEGDFHEALNVAAVWDLPVIFVIENNGYGLSTPAEEQYRANSLVDKAAGYGMEGVQIQGNNLLTVYDTIRGVREYCISNRKPYLVECMTFRMRGHEEASGTKYVPAELMEEWQRKDPILQFESFIEDLGLLDGEKAGMIREEMKAWIDEEVKLAEENLVPETLKELQDVFAPDSSPAASVIREEKEGENTGTTEKRFIEAIREGLWQSMEKHTNLVLMGQDIAEYGGAFKITEGFLREFGRERVRNTPLCESAIVGAALGLSLEGFKSVVEMQFSDFASVAFNQIVNNLAKIHYRWGQNADVVIRMPAGGGVGAGPFHSQTSEAWFTHCPGLKIVYPSSPEDAKGLLIAAIRDPNPVLYFEHKALYRSISGSLPEQYYSTPLGVACSVRKGDAVSIITYGAAVHWALEYASGHPELSLDILDLRTLIPLDHDAVRASVKRTGKVLVLHEASFTGGFGAEIAAWVAENCFELLDAPVIRCASLDTPIPFNLELEKNYLAKSRLDESVRRLLRY
jgi:2-oxoisovalerate dehydrogenase E1 component